MHRYLKKIQLSYEKSDKIVNKIIVKLKENKVRKKILENIIVNDINNNHIRENKVMKRKL